MNVVVLGVGQDTGRRFNEVDKISFVDANTHGPGKTFGLSEDDLEGKHLIISSPNVVAATVESEYE